MKRIILWIIAVLTLSALLISVSAAPSYLADGAGLLTVQEQAKLSQALDDICARLGIDVVVVTADSLNGRSAADFADRYYDDNAYADNGILLLVAMQEREWYISTCGSCIDAVDEWGTDSISSHFLDDLSSGEYYDAFLSYALICEKLFTEGMTDEEPVITYGDNADTGLSGKTVLICVIIGIAVGLITVLVMRSQLKSVRAQGYAGSYVQLDSLELTNSRDIYLYRNVSRRERPKSNSSSGGGGSRSHVGGGGSF